MFIQLELLVGKKHTVLHRLKMHHTIIPQHVAMPEGTTTLSHSYQVVAGMMIREQHMRVGVTAMTSLQQILSGMCIQSLLVYLVVVHHTITCHHFTLSLL